MPSLRRSPGRPNRRRPALQGLPRFFNKGIFNQPYVILSTNMFTYSKVNSNTNLAPWAPQPARHGFRARFRLGPGQKERSGAGLAAADEPGRERIRGLGRARGKNRMRVGRWGRRCR